MNLSRLLMIAIATFPPASLAANFYVRAGATGLNNGSDWQNAWPQLPANLGRGNTYYVADGSYGSYTFDDTHSGSATITIKKATAADHGTDIGWNSAFGDGQATFSGGLTFTRGYYVLDGVTKTTPTSGHGFKIIETAGKGIRFGTASGDTPDNITVRYMEIQGQLDTGVSNDGLYTVFGADDIVLQHLHVHHLGRVFILTRSSNRWTLENSYFRYNSSDPVQHGECWSDGQSNDFVIRFNVFEDFEGTGCIVVLNGAGNPRRWKIYGNVFFASNSNPENRTNFVPNATIACITGEAAIDWEIYNNTNYNLRGFCAGYNLAYDTPGALPPSGNIMRNNIWVNSETASCHGGFAVNSHNYYSGTPFNPTESNVQSASGVPFAGAAVGNFRLTGATSAGFSLAAPYNLDPDGKTRGGEGVWDRGAFEYGEAAARLSAPTNLRIVE